MLVLALVLSLQLVSNPNVVSANSAHLAPGANSPSIPNYQWQFISPSEKAAVDASMKVIMNERFKNITLNIHEDAGAPFIGRLQVTQRSTDFIYSAGWPGYYWDDYLAMTPSHSYSVYAPWSYVEAVQGQWNFKGPDSDYADALSVKHGLTDFHIFLGPYYGPCCPDMAVPDWAKGLEQLARSNSSDYEVLKSAMREYVEAVVSHFKGRISQYELWWEANAWYGNGYWPLDRIIDIIKMEATTIRAVDPAARIYIDLVRMTPDAIQYENGKTLNNWTTEDFIQQLLAAGVPFDVIGLETHIGTGWAETAGDISALYNWLIELARFGKPLYIWEDGLESYLPPDWVAKQSPPWWKGTWHGTPSEAKQTEYMVAETLVYLGNPSVIGLHWMLLNDESPWSVNLSDDGVLYANGTRKMSFYALQALWNSLMVNETVQSVNGVATFKGLAGNYSISAQGYEVEPSVVHVSEGKPSTFSLVLRSTTRTTTSITSTTPTTSGTVTPNRTGAVPSYIEYLAVIVVLGAIVVGSILISRKRARTPANARESISKMKDEKGVQFCINCGSKLQPESKFCNKCGSAQT